MSDKFLKLVSGQRSEGQSTDSSSVDAIPALDATGRLNVNMMPDGIEPEILTLPTSENLAAGDFVNIYNATGTLTARKADASNNRSVDGFVLAVTSSPANAAVYLAGNNTAVSGRTVGAEQWLSTNGALCEVGGLPTGAGKIIQKIGRAVSATEVTVEPDDPILLIA
jgi:hypothetical protein